jgi:hypothetical protein
MATAGRDSYIRQVRVELADGFNFVGAVQREYFDSRGRRTVLIEDSTGQERAVRPAYPSVTVHDLDDGQDGVGGGRS